MQSLLVTYTTSYYNYSANVHRRLPVGLQWTAAFNGTHSGLTNYQGTQQPERGLFDVAWIARSSTLNGIYTQSTGISLLGAGGFVPITPTPGVSDFITFSGSSYGGGISVTPDAATGDCRQLQSRDQQHAGGRRSRTTTLKSSTRRLQYHLRRIGLQAGYTRFTQGISAVGAPANTTSYFVGISRWFDFF